MIVASLSVHHYIDKVGTYAGFAAAIGLALFALLLFAQARELKRLREWGAQAHDRIGELERRLAAALELARRASATQRTGAVPAQRSAAPARPAPARPVLARTSAPTRLPLLPAAPAGVGGAALGSATVVVPLPKQPPGAAPAADAPAPAAAPATSTPATSTPATAPTATPVPPATPPATAAAIPAAAAAASAATASTAAPAPATVAAQGTAEPVSVAPAPSAPSAPAHMPAAPAAGNGHSDTFPPVPPVRRPAPPARAGAGRRPSPRPAQRPAPAAPLRQRGPATATPRGTGNGTSSRSPHGRRLIFLLAGLGVIAVVVIAAIALTGGGSNSPSQTSATSSSTPAQQTTGAAQTTPAAAPAHDKITVAVLNGTTTAGLAQTVASSLVADGFVQGPVTNASDQQRSVTVVSYFGGHEREAQEVAKALNVPSDAVQPIDPDTEAACAQGGACTATVVVTVGADRQ